MMLKISIFTIGLIILSGCISSDPYEKYMGYWERNDTKTPHVILITEEGGTVLLTENLYHDGSEKRVLNKFEGGLSTNLGLAVKQFSLSDDANTLNISSLAFTRVKDSRVKEIKKDIKENKENQILCHELIKTYNEKGIWFGQILSLVMMTSFVVKNKYYIQW